MRICAKHCVFPEIAQPLLLNRIGNVASKVRLNVRLACATGLGHRRFSVESRSGVAASRFLAAAAACMILMSFAGENRKPFRVAAM